MTLKVFVLLKGKIAGISSTKTQVKKRELL
jgi:hypothetical protein